MEEIAILTISVRKNICSNSGNDINIKKQKHTLLNSSLAIKIIISFRKIKLIGRVVY